MSLVEKPFNFFFNDEISLWLLDRWYFDFFNLSHRKDCMYSHDQFIYEQFLLFFEFSNIKKRYFEILVGNLIDFEFNLDLVKKEFIDLKHLFFYTSLTTGVELPKPLFLKLVLFDCCETRLCLMDNLLNISDVKRVYKFHGMFINYYTQRFMNNFFVEILFPPLLSDCYCDLMVFKSLSNLLRYINVDFITLFISFKALNDQSLKKKFFYYIKVFLTNYILRKKLEIISINGQILCSSSFKHIAYLKSGATLDGYVVDEKSLVKVLDFKQRVLDYIRFCLFIQKIFCKLFFKGFLF
mmetsp:Transcript_29373/g.51545  ORF Transcript_29373/g.51545 Transcript_29373/m.51545 type:complete len:296 (-) Transcript_29373:1487-2374(-)